MTRRSQLALIIAACFLTGLVIVGYLVAHQSGHRSSLTFGDTTIDTVLLGFLTLGISGKQYANNNTATCQEPNPRHSDTMLRGKNSRHDKHAPTKSRKNTASPFRARIEKLHF